VYRSKRDSQHACNLSIFKSFRSQLKAKTIYFRKREKYTTEPPLTLIENDLIFRAEYIFGDKLVFSSVSDEFIAVRLNSALQS